MSIIHRAKLACHVISVFAANVMKYPSVFKRVDRVWFILPEDIEEALTVITREPMNDASAAQVLMILDDAGL